MSSHLSIKCELSYIKKRVKCVIMPTYVDIKTNVFHRSKKGFVLAHLRRLRVPYALYLPTSPAAAPGLSYHVTLARLFSAILSILSHDFRVPRRAIKISRISFDHRLIVISVTLRLLASFRKLRSDTALHLHCT